MIKFDVSKLKKSINKAIPGISTGFRDPSVWVSTGSYVLNKLISGDFKKGIPLGKSTMFAGESGCLPATSTVEVQVMVEDGFRFETVTIEQLKEMWVKRHSNHFTIRTPDGYQRIGQWFNKGVLPMVKVVASYFSGTTLNTITTTCAENHLIQEQNDTWTMAYHLKVGDVVQTVHGLATITEVTSIAAQECFDFEILHPNHRYYGDGFVSHNSGKSFIVSGNIVKNAQEQGIYVVLIDTENALDEQWLWKFGVDTSEDCLLKINAAMINDVALIINNFMEMYKAQAPEDRKKVLFVIDSLGMLMTPTDVDQFQSGDMKGDMGRKPKALKQLVTNVTNMFGEFDIGLVCTNHTYASQDMYNPDPKVSGGCLVADTKVLMEDGTFKSIQDMQIGDIVQTLYGPNKVDGLHQYVKETYTIEVEIDGVVKAVTCSPEHKFLTVRDENHVWVEAKDLTETDVILSWVDQNI